jgi:hypothetical protein
MAEIDSFRSAVAHAGSNMRVPALSLVRSDPNLATVISKLVPDQRIAHYGVDGNRQPEMPNTGLLRETSERISQNVSDAQTVLQILPDMELAAQILVSCVLSPKDMTTTEITYSVTEGLLAPDVSSALIAEARGYFEQTYKIKPLLGKILRDMLFETGSYPVSVIPENSLDEVINGNRRITMEALSEVVYPDGSPRNRGLLGPALSAKAKTARKSAGVSLEAFDAYIAPEQVEVRMSLEGIINTQGVNDHPVVVSDNFDMLKIPEVNHKIREQRILSIVKSGAAKHFGRALESHEASQRDLGNMNDRQLASLLYRQKNFAYKPITTLKTQDQLNRRSVGNPLVMHMPSESVIPVHIPGSPDKHVGFFVLLDADGHPVRKNPNEDYYQQLSTRMTSQGNFASAMLAKVRQMNTGFDPRNARDLDYSARVYGQMVEQDLLARLRNGVYTNGVAVAKKEEVWRIMLSRALAQQHTQLLFLPVELMTYFAFKYTDDGVGKSLMEDMKILNSLRSMLTFANVMAALKNSIGRTEVKLKLDPDDPNPQKTIEMAMHEIIRSRAAYFPVGVNRPMDIVDFLQRSNFEFTYEGHPGMPDVAVDFGEKSSNYVKPDTELEDTLRKRSIMGLGLSPENVDAGFNAEFATSVLHNNLLLSKRVMQMQEVFTPQLSDHLRKVIMNSEELTNKFREILDNNFEKLKNDLSDEAKQKLQAKDGSSEVLRQAIVDQFLHEFVMSFEATLPQPNTVTLENQLAALDKYIEGLDKTLDAYVSDKFYTSDMGGDTATHVATIKEVLKAYFIRQWMAENGVMPELSQLTTLGPDGKAAVDVMEAQKSHLEGLTKSIGGLLAGLQPSIKAGDKRLEKAGVGGGSEPPATSTDTTGGGGDAFDFGGGPDLGLGDTPGGEAAPGGEPAPPAPGAEAEPTETEPGAEAKPAGTEDDEEGKDKPAADDKTAA